MKLSPTVDLDEKLGPLPTISDAPVRHLGRIHPKVTLPRMILSFCGVEFLATQRIVKGTVNENRCPRCVELQGS